MKLLLDSVILIDHFNGIQAATDFMSAHYKQSFISVITRAEVLAGFEKKQLKKATLLLDSFLNLSIEKQDADLAAQLRRKYKWKLHDALQAAVSNHHGLKLVTRNTKDFNPKKHDFVVIPYVV